MPPALSPHGDPPSARAAANATPRKARSHLPTGFAIDAVAAVNMCDQPECSRGDAEFY